MGDKHADFGFDSHSAHNLVQKWQEPCSSDAAAPVPAIQLGIRQTPHQTDLFPGAEQAAEARLLLARIEEERAFELIRSSSPLVFVLPFQLF
ncbi:uncharacterized [Tachysurus ichikawai]